jgi:glutamate-1-semialdehyde 2,1-aminomutase
MTSADLTGDSSTGAKLLRAAREVIPGGVNSATRLVGAPHALTGASGAYVTDADGRRYLDYHAAFGAILLGHGAPEVDGGIDLVGWGVTEPEIELARLVVELIPSADQMISAMSGSEAVAHAVRLARAVTDRPLIVKFQGGFHGWQDAVARNVISAPGRAYARDPLSRCILDAALDATLIAEFNDLDSVRELYERHPERIAAVITEPIPHNVGALLPETEFIEGLRAITAEQGSLLIFDEVITGFRHALGGYQQICGVMPDLTTFGKAMGNGYPIAGLAGSRELMERFSSAGGDVLLAGTFNGNPISSAAGIATVNYLRDHPDFYERTYALGDRVRAGLGEIAGELGIPAVPAGFGGVFALYFVDGPVSGYRDLLRDNDEAYVAFHRRMTDRGFLMLPLALKRNHISAAHTEADIDRTLEAARDVLRSIRDDGLLR